MNLLIKSQLEGGESTEKNGVLGNCAAQGAAVDTENRQFDSDLQIVVEAWLGLPDVVKDGILAMVKSARGSKTGGKID